MRVDQKTFWLGGGVIVIAVLIVSWVLVPNLAERVGWRWQEFWASTRRQVLQLPDTLPTAVSVAAAAPTPAMPTPEAVATLPPSPVPTQPRPAPPPQAELSGVTQVWQRVNNCGPATLAMALSFWGWKGTQANTANALKPDPNDRNVSPEEMAAYARKVGLHAEIRMGGTLPRVKDLIAAGFPVLLQTTVLLPEKGWEGHYTLVTGYSDERQQVTTQDSLRGPNFIQTYADLERDWRAFNFLYIVLYPPERQADLDAALGPDLDAQAALRRSASVAQAETARLTEQALAFAWFNLGTSLTASGEWAGAAGAYDAARQTGLPWRMLWYQHGPLEAYFQAGRYTEVVALAEATLAQADNIEEVYYWRGRARAALGDVAGAAEDWRAALGYNRNFAAPVQALAEAGLTP